MRKLTTALLSGAYFSLALMAALAAWRIGGGAGVGAAALVGALGFCFALHALIGRGIETSRLADEVAAVREAHLMLTSEVEKLHNRIADMVEAAAGDALRRTEQIYDEVQLLEDVVQQLGERIDTPASRSDAHPATRAPVSPQASALLQTVRQALETGRVDLYLQPIGTLPQRRTQYYEGFSRLRDETGRVLMPAEFLSVAEPGGLIAAIDNLLLFRCVQIVRRLAKQERKVGIFCNISLASLADQEFFGPFVEFLAANRDLAGALVFELGQSAYRARGAVEARSMAKLADLGYRFSIDKVSDLNLDFVELARSDVGFAKVAAPLLLDQLQEFDGHLVFESLPGVAASEFAGLARQHGVELVVEKVESERQVVDILELNVGLGQGLVFGEPRPIRDAVLAEAAPPPGLIQAALGRLAG